MSAPFATMPEAPIDEDGEIGVGKVEIRIAGYSLWMQYPTGNLAPHQRHAQSQLSALVAASSNCGHNLRTFWRNIELATGELRFE